MNVTERNRLGLAYDLTGFRLYLTLGHELSWLFCCASVYFSTDVIAEPCWRGCKHGVFRCLVDWNLL